MKRLGTALTLIESVVVIAIILVLVAFLLPVFSRAKRSAHIADSVSRMRQLYVSLTIYQADNDAVPSITSSTSYNAIGLPPDHYFVNTMFGFSSSFWRSPCGLDLTIHNTGPTRVPGWIVYASPFYDPAVFTPSGNVPYHHYLETYRENAVVFVDPFCNDAGTVMSAPLTSKRALAVLLSGQVVNKMRTGNAFLLQFYSDPPAE